ncbi:formate dehydrogenase subunit delta [Roseovarius autotrophicus]|uniref:formate dehydrogenase subunit delta n=1 Tax=Roseovarius autotrophicus TaxID=2824121 RepID=UPI0019FFD95E|nr:formate dehydrogenase subunit delta [Roseovarius autotrophicus]MBE0453574.1 formate dehydrogenase subunit delta [Roseovarius sp.]
MSPEKMVHMANQIATFFKTQPGTDQAVRVALHLTDYWEPRMLAQLHAHVSAGGEGLDDLVTAAAARIAEARERI